MELLLLVGLLILMFAFFNLSNRVSRLEHALREGAKTVSPKKEESDEWHFLEKKSEHGHAPHEGGTVGRFVSWLKEDWLLKLGALLLLLGFGWLATYAFAHNWIGPTGRITLGIIAGVLILAFGWWRMRTYVAQGSVFVVLGSAVILLTIFAGRELYDFFTPASALVMMFVASAFVAVASVVYKRPSLAFAGLILAAIAPLFTNAPTPNHIGLFAYLLVVIAGTVWVVAVSQQRSLTLGALVVFALYSLPYLSGAFTTDRGVLLLFAYAFAGLLYVSNSAGILKSEKRHATSDLIAATGNGLLLIAWILVAAPDHLKSIIIVTWMLVFSAGSFLLFSVTKKIESLYVYAGVGVAMLAAATAAELEGPALTIAYAIESAIIPWLVFAVTKKISSARVVSFLTIGPILLSLESVFSRAWRVSVLHEHFAVLATMALITFTIGILFYIQKQQHKTRTHVWFISIGSAYVYILLWLSLHAGIEQADTATAIALIVYALVGLVTYVFGHMRDIRTVRIYAAVILGLLTLRLLFIDVWDMNLTGRIITFFVIGILFMSTAFLRKK